jgi:hypothetical protein
MNIQEQTYKADEGVQYWTQKFETLTLEPLELWEYQALQELIQEFADKMSKGKRVVVNVEYVDKEN